MSSDEPTIILCNGARLPCEYQSGTRRVHSLDYRARQDEAANVRIDLPNFLRYVFHLPDRMLDLLELAAYVYCADRKISRGSKDLVEYHAWARNLLFVVRVRDDEFWNDSKVQKALSESLKFMTGDEDYRFIFQGGHYTPPTDLFDSRDFHIWNPDQLTIIPFSGGLDSLSGAIDSLKVQSADRVCLVSHQSQPGTVRTQNQLARALKHSFPDQVRHYKFRCNLTGARAVEESQRSRSFLYTSISCALAYSFGQDRFSIYENGITSINFSRREDLANARASRTTHPQTLWHLERLFSLIAERDITIDTPFLWHTKADVLKTLCDTSYVQLLPSSVSCSKTFKRLHNATHCGGCSQCIDRRIAVYARRLEDWEKSNIYADDIISQSINGPDSREVMTTAVDYIRQARNFSQWNIDHFYHELLHDLSELIDFLPGRPTEEHAINCVWELCRRHGSQVLLALNRMREEHDDLFEEVKTGSLLQIISDREYLKTPVERIVESLEDLLVEAVPRMFGRNPPSNEADLNRKVNALLESHRTDLRREHPVVSFAGANVVPDHGDESYDVLVESKYIRGGTSPSKASDGMAADLTKYPQESHVLFLVLDQERAIVESQRFKLDFEARGRCTVLIIR